MPDLNIDLPKYAEIFDSGLADVEMLDVINEKFSKGEGVLMLNANMPDDLLLLMVKHALKASQGKPFKVVSCVDEDKIKE